MKVIDKILVFLVLVIGVSGCFDPPEFSTTPEIEFESIYFGETPTFSDPDSIVIVLNFRDGDGNVGIDQITTTNGEVIDNINDPYHDSNFYLSEGGSSLKEIGTEVFYTDTFQNGVAEFVPLKIFTTRNQNGKLVTRKNQAGYTGTSPSLPVFDPQTLNCAGYTRESLFVFESDWNIIDATYSIADTLRDAFGNRFIHLKDTTYFLENPNHYTIEVDFFVKEGNTFREYDWREEFCTTYNGRFSQLSDTDTPLEGTINYSMKSTGFKTVFSVKTLKLEITIKDRDLNISNKITTPEFTLDKIKR